MTRLGFAVLSLICSAILLPAQTHQLTTGMGLGRMRVTVDGYGGYGGCFTPVGDLFFDTATGTIPTACGSAFILHEPSAGLPRPFSSYATGGFPAPLPTIPITVNVPGQDIQSTWNYMGFDITCRQQIFGPNPSLGPNNDGSTLVQTYTLVNNTTNVRTISVARWLDTDIGAGTQWTMNSGGATGSVASLAGGAPPYTANGHIVFAYDATTNFVCMTSMEIVNEGGIEIESDRWGVFNNNAGLSWNTIGGGGAGALPNAVVPDTTGDLLSDSLLDIALGVGATNLTISPMSTITVVTRTRLAFLDGTSTTPVWEQARNLSATAYNGTFFGAGIQNMLCVNGSTGVVPVGFGAPFNVSLALPFSATSSAYILFLGVGSPGTGNPCGAPRTMDYCHWGSPFANLGIGCMPAGATWLPTVWTGGGQLSAATPVLSDLPGFALLQSVPLSAGFPCGGLIAAGVSISQDIVLTLQGLIVEAGAPLNLALTNSVTIPIGACPTPTR